MEKKAKGGEMWKKREERERERDSGKDQDLSWDCRQFSKRIPILTTATQHDVEMADTALYLNLC